MNMLRVRWPAIAVVIGLFAVLSSGCAVTAGGYGYDSGVGVGIGLNYYEPYGVDYGGWGPGYAVGPVRGGGYRVDHGRGQPAPHAYRSAPTSRSAPSIPSRSRSGGWRPR